MLCLFSSILINNSSICRWSEVEQGGLRLLQCSNTKHFDLIILISTLTTH